MTDHDDVQHRTYHQSDPGRTQIRESDDDDDTDGVFTVRMPIASTGDVRNEGDEALTRDELEGMADQVADQSPGVFLDHGSNMDIGGSRYSATGKVGEWTAPDLEENEAGETLLEADARLMDPETLPESTGSVREALSTLQAQVDRGLGLSSSIGWRDDESSPGGVDLMEASIVGIPADPRTTSHDASTEALARAASVARGQDDPAAVVEQFRSVVMGPDEQQRHLSAQQAETAETLLNAYRDEQGNGSVENFEGWLWNVAYHTFDDNEFHAAQTALQEFYRETTPLEEPVDEQFIPFLSNEQGGDDSSDEGGDARDSVTETDDTTESGGDGADPDGTNNDDGQDDMDAQEYRESMLEMQRTQTETLSTLAEAIREDDEDDEDGDDEDDDGDDEDEDGGENSVDEDDVDERTVTVDGEERSVADALDDLREQSDAADASSTEGSQTNDRSEGDSDDDATQEGFGFAGAT